MCNDSYVPDIRHISKLKAAKVSIRYEFNSICFETKGSFFRINKKIIFVKKGIVCIVLLFSITSVQSQTGTEFWFAPPEVTDLHNAPGGEPIYLIVTSQGSAATVTIDQPANPGFNGGSPIVVMLAANQSRRINLTPFKNDLETDSTNFVMNTGLHISSTATITTYYEISNTNNPDIFALKGENSLGTEFYIPLHRHAPFYNHTFAAPHEAYASFDIIATEDNTLVTIYSPVQVDGHPALTQFSITLNKGQTYSCAWTGTNYDQPSTHPGGAVVLSDKPIAVSIKDDSNHNPSGGCYDLMGDQIVPVDILGTEYVAVKGSLNPTGDESVFIVGTQNNTKVYINGNMSPIKTLFAGEVFRIDIDSLAASVNNAIYVTLSKPAYAMHVTGFGCEQGIAQLPPLNCAGSSQVSFVRSTTEGFFLTILVRATAVNDFSIVGSGTAIISPDSFLIVPGTGGEWMAARIKYNTTEIPVDSTFRISNTTDVFALGIINGGGGTGCRYGYFSEFQAKTLVNAGVNQSICANKTLSLNGVVSGSTLQGIWSTNGTGTFADSSNLNTTYVFSALDTTIGSLTFVLQSVGPCFPATDTMLVTITPAPKVNAGTDINVCAANPVATLNGSVTIAAGGQWSVGLGNYNPNNTTLNASYTPSALEVGTGMAKLALTSIGNGGCNAESDTVLIFINPAPIVDAGSDQVTCFNDLDIQLNGNVSGGTTTGKWKTLGSGNFTPDTNSLNAVYHASVADSLVGSVKLVLTSTNNNGCNPGRDTMKIDIFGVGTAQIINNDTSLCSNNALLSLQGTVAGQATGATWSSSGTGTFSPSNTSLNVTYTPSVADKSSGSIKISLTANSCDFYKDSITITYTPSPVVNAGTDILSCVDDLDIELNGNISGATTTGMWSTNGTGSFTPDNITLNATYEASSLDSSNGQVRLILEATNFGNCLVVRDTLFAYILEGGTVNAGPTNDTTCANVPLNLNGIVGGGASKGKWTTNGGGSFSPNDTTLNAIYNPVNSDTALTSVFLILSATNSCNIAGDTLFLKVTVPPSANAGIDQSICANNTITALTGVIKMAGGGSWSGGAGIYAPHQDSLNINYTPTSTEISNGFVYLTLTTTNNGVCNARRDSVKINFTAAPIVSAGVDQGVCITSAATKLMGSISGGASSGVWNTLGDGSFSFDSILNPNYVYGTSDTTNGFVDLVLTSTYHGNCLAEKDTMRVIFGNTAFVYAGQDQNVCDADLIANLSGFVTGGATTGLWTTSGTGTFTPTDSNLNATYQLTSNDSLSGSITLWLTSTNNGMCNAGKDSLQIILEKSPVADAGSDVITCPGADVSILGVVINATGGKWSTNGTGTFFPNDSSLNVIYTPSLIDSIAGNIILTLTTKGQTECNAANDQMKIKYEIPLEVDFSNAIPCQDVATQFTDNTNILSGGIDNWEWDFGTGTNIFAQNTSFTYDTSGAYNVSLIVTSDLGCTSAKTKTITVNVSPKASFNHSDKCFGDSTLFTSTSSILAGNIISYIWYFNESDTNFDNKAQVKYLYDSAAIYPVTLSVTSDKGCIDTVINNITILPEVIANFYYDSTEDLRAKEIINFMNISSGETFWDWNFGDKSGFSDNKNPQYVYEEKGDYTVILIVSNDINCKDTAFIDITVLQEKIVLPPAVPQGFSPNGDGENDTLFVRGGPFKALEFKLYNQWGELVFETQTESTGWDGFRKSIMQPLGIYTYTLFAITDKDEEFNKSGSITLIR